MTPPQFSSSTTSHAKTQQNFNPMPHQGYYFDPSGRQTPINVDDPNDHRNYVNGPDLSLPAINRFGDGMIYHDFDYIGY